MTLNLSEFKYENGNEALTVKFFHGKEEEKSFLTL